jgi:hypothetical protein
MYFFKTLLFLLPFYAFHLNAQFGNEESSGGEIKREESTSSKTQENSTTFVSSLLWKMEGKGFKKNVYLFGTMHLIEREYFYFPKKIVELVQNSDQLVTELGDINPADGMDFLKLKKGKFFDYFSKEQTDSILAYAEKNLNMNEVQFRMMMSNLKPLAMVQFATIKTFKGPTESYDLYIMNIALENQKPIIGLETFEEQLALFDKLDSTENTNMVMESIRPSENAKSEFENLELAYQQQDVEKLYQLIHQSSGVFSAMGIDLLDNRNSNWVKQIIKIAQKKSTFIAVGAGHLGGPKGLIQQFRNEGYTLTQIKY